MPGLRLLRVGCVASVISESEGAVNKASWSELLAVPIAPCEPRTRHRQHPLAEQAHLARPVDDRPGEGALRGVAHEYDGRLGTRGAPLIGDGATTPEVLYAGVYEGDGAAAELAENCIFNDCLNVARRQLGCMRFCSVPVHCRTPRRYNCQPDLVSKPILEARAQGTITEAETDRRLAIERQRVQPQFTDRRYGRPGYGQLADTCAIEIKRGADDESEMGAFHDLYNPQREANLRARLSTVRVIVSFTGSLDSTDS